MMRKRKNKEGPKVSKCYSYNGFGCKNAMNQMSYTCARRQIHSQEDTSKAFVYLRTQFILTLTNHQSKIMSCTWEEKRKAKVRSKRLKVTTTSTSYTERET